MPWSTRRPVVKLMVHYSSMGFFSKIILSLTIFTAVFATAAPVFAAYGLDEAAKQAGLNSGVAGGTTVESVVGNIVSIALSMIGIIFFLLIVYAGFTWMIARGNTEAVDKSKSIIEGAVIGLIIVMAAYAITNFVFKSLDQGVATPPASSNATVFCGTSQKGVCMLEKECTGSRAATVSTYCVAAGAICCE